VNDVAHAFLPNSPNVQSGQSVTRAAISCGYYEWLRHPISARTREDQRLLVLIRASYTASHGIYGAPRIFLDLREAGETCSKHRVAQIMRANQIRAHYGCRALRSLRGRMSLRVPNTLQRRFTVEQPNEAWATDITYVRTWQGCFIWPW